MVADSLRQKVFELDNYRCAYCHSPIELTVAIFEVEHIKPQSKGGVSEIDNLCLACPPCNRYKGSLEETIDPKTGDLAPLFHPRQQNWLQHFAWDETFTMVIGLTPTGRATIVLLKMNRPRLTNLRQLWAKLGYQLE